MSSESDVIWLEVIVVKSVVMMVAERRDLFKLRMIVTSFSCEIQDSHPGLFSIRKNVYNKEHNSGHTPQRNASRRGVFAS